MDFKAEPFPMIFSVAKKKVVFGTVTMDASHNATFEPTEGADPKLVGKFQKSFSALIASDEAMYDYSDYDGDTHYSCAARVKKGDPKYPGAFKMAIYSWFYDIEEKK